MALDKDKARTLPLPHYSFTHSEDRTWTPKFIKVMWCWTCTYEAWFVTCRLGFALFNLCTRFSFYLHWLQRYEKEPKM